MMKRIVMFCMMLFAGFAVYAANNGDDSVSTMAVPMEQSVQDDDGWSLIGNVTLYHNCNCCNTCDGNLGGETRNAKLYVKEVTPGKLMYKVRYTYTYERDIAGRVYPTQANAESAVAAFSHSSGYTIGRGTITYDDWDFYLYL